MFRFSFVLKIETRTQDLGHISTKQLTTVSNITKQLDLKVAKKLAKEFGRKLLVLKTSLYHCLVQNDPSLGHKADFVIHTSGRNLYRFVICFTDLTCGKGHHRNKDSNWCLSYR